MGRSLLSFVLKLKHPKGGESSKMSVKTYSHAHDFNPFIVIYVSISRNK